MAVFYYRTCLCLQYVLRTIHMKVYSKWWPMAMWTYKALVNELGRLALGSSSLQYLCDTRRCGIPRRALREGTRAVACSTAASERRPGQHWVRNPSVLTVLTCRNGQLSLKAHGEKLLLAKTCIHTAHTERPSTEQKGHSASQSLGLSLKGIFYFLILKIIPETTLAKFFQNETRC